MSAPDCYEMVTGIVRKELSDHRKEINKRLDTFEKKLEGVPRFMTLTSENRTWLQVASVLIIILFSLILIG